MTAVSTRAASPIVVRIVEARELKEAERLSQEVFGFSDRNVVPAWEMFFVTRHGGLALGAFAGDLLVGFSYAFPAVEAGCPFLYSNGLSVRPEFESRGIGARLKQAQRRHALELGYARIRWTANPLNSQILYVSLTKLGATLVEFAPGLVEDLIPELAMDDVVIDWDLRRDVARRAVHDPLPVVNAGGSRARAVTSRGDEPCLVEIPWRWRSLRGDGSPELSRWRASVASALPPLLDAGLRGDEVVLDRREQRAYIRFTRP